jgi:aspartyl/asparaginyl-tRNA synthetase
VSYTEAIEILEKHLAEKKTKFLVKPFWGMDMGSEHERYLICYNYPKTFKAFYMK